MNGYPQVVEALLRHQRVRDQLEAPGPYELTPWQLTNLAPQLTLMVINPTNRTNAWKLVPWMVKVPFYVHTKLAPYQRCRAALEQAGAKRKSEPVRKFLLESEVCPDTVKAKVRNAKDILTALRGIVLSDSTYGLPALRHKR